MENLNNGDAGYTEAYNVRIVSEQEAMTAVKTPEPTIAPIETPTPEPTEEPTPDPTPEPVPQELTEGDLYHYGYTTTNQLKLRKQPSTSANSDGEYEKGTIVWVIRRDGDWCQVRVKGRDGYMMSKYIRLMGVEEEKDYVASLSDPE